MSFKTVLAPLDGGVSSKAVLKAAFLLADKFQAHVRVLHIKADPRSVIPLLGEGMSGALIDDMIQTAEQENAERRDQTYLMFQDYASDVGAEISSVPVAASITTSWVEDEGREDEIIARYGRLADIVLVPKPQEESDLYSTLALNSALFETGRPMLLLPDQGVQTFGKVVTVCWNGSMEGARAVSAAMPFLRKASKVYVITAETSATSGIVGGELRNYLSWHEVCCEHVHFSPTAQSVGEALLDQSRQLKADMMVMGGYSHSRLREMILGGVTRDVIELADIPVLMGH